MEELQQTLREEEARLLQLVDELVQSYVRSIRMAEEHKHKIEQLDLEQSSYCQPFSEKLVQLSQVSVIAN